MKFIIFIILVFGACNMSKTEIIREPAVSGQFYPADKIDLTNIIKKFLNNVKDISVSGEIKGLLVPHAGYIFSGQVSAYSYKLLENRKFDTVLIIGQSHNFYLKKPALYLGDYFQSPLGKVPIDKEFVSELLKSSDFFEENKIAHRPEHSIEVQIPFLQVVMSNFKIVPVLVSDADLGVCEKTALIISNVIKKFKDKKIITIISSDMSHYPKYEDANYVDNKTLNALEKFDPVFFKSTCDEIMKKNIQNLACTYCGQTAIIIGMYLTKNLGANKIKILKYYNSGDVEQFGDKNRVVGYSSVVFLKEEKETQLKGEKMQETFSISEKNQKILLKLARDTIIHYFKTKTLLPFTTQDQELLQKSAVFVTLTMNHNLRGCIGTTVPQVSLYQIVQQMALASAFEDTRFSPLTFEELKNVKIEISVLSSLTRVKSAENIIPNIHGVVVKKGFRSGLFLPQVWEHFSKKEDFLNELCWQKAGLEPDAWKKPDTELYVFTVFSFEEK